MGKFRRIDTPIEGLYIIEPTMFGDQRGFFMETYSVRDFEDIGITAKFVQDNHSKSSKGVLRGLHFQTQQTQAKLMRVTRGRILDAAVDLRTDSKTYGNSFSIELSSENKKMLYVPKRFAHGFLTIEEGTEFSYKCTDYYCPEADSGVAWNDADIAIDWQFEKYGIDQSNLNISVKDSSLQKFEEINPNDLWK